MNDEMRQQIAELANAEAPKEACGFVLDGTMVVACTNVDDAPWYRFMISDEEARQWYGSGRVTGVWHSHPTGPAVPSPADEETAAAGNIFLDHIIYSVEDEDLATYLIDADGKLRLVEMLSPA